MRSFRLGYDIADSLAQKDIDVVAVLTPSGLHPDEEGRCV
jgi:predicted dehydrogenase